MNKTRSSFKSVFLISFVLPVSAALSLVAAAALPASGNETQGQTVAALPAPTPTPTPTPSPTPPAAAGPVTVTATAGTVGPTNYITVQAAFAAVNGGTHQGNVTVWVMANTTETSSAVLNGSGTGSASYTSLLLLPNGTRTVSGAIAAGSPLIDLNGARNVRIDGYGSLTLSNTTVSAIAGTSTVRFVNGAQNDILANCTLRGSSTSAIGVAGGNVLFSTSTAASGNNNNTVIGNQIGPAGSNLPTKCVMGLGTSGKANTGNLISNNNIFDFFSPTTSVTGVSVWRVNNNWTISNNRIYQTASRTFAGNGLRYAGITLNAATGVFSVNFNTIGFGTATGTGTTTISGASNEFRGIDAPATNPGAITNIQGNVISGINQRTSRGAPAVSSAPFIGIAVGVADGLFDIGSTAGNTIGSLNRSSGIVITATSTVAGAAPVVGIYDFSLGDDVIANNKIGTVTINSGGTGTSVGFRGILTDGTAGQTVRVLNNVIGGTAAGSITDNISGNYAMYGIHNTGDPKSADLFASGNLIRNMTGNANGQVVAMAGIENSPDGTGVTEISRNTIHSLSNSSNSASNAPAIYGIDVTLPVFNPNVVQRNLIHSISMSSPISASQIAGIVMRSGSASFRNNMVRLGLDRSGNSITQGFSIVGIRDVTDTASYYFNSVYIGGSNVASASGTFAFNSSATFANRNFINNIFWNARSNGSGSGKNYAIAVGGTEPNPPGLTSNYNDLLATGTGSFVGLFSTFDYATLADWQTATGQDANSISANPLFVNANGTAATGNLHIQSGSPALGAGTPVGITKDFDNNARDPVHPDMGADER